jgi:hypothetical protein
MFNVPFQVSVKFRDLMGREEGQDLVEHTLVVALILLGQWPA